MPAEWTCPKCKNRMYSAYDGRDSEYVQCVSCEFWFLNPYYLGGEKCEEDSDGL